MAAIAESSEMRRIAIIDDQPDARQALVDNVSDAGWNAISIEGPLVDLDNFVQCNTTQAIAAICDHHLRKRNYATFDGAQVVARFYEAKFPAILCTRYEDATINEIRYFRRYIPILLNPKEVDGDVIESSLSYCKEEFKGNFSQTRRPWRNLVRVEEFCEDDENWFYAVIPGWHSEKLIRLARRHLPTLLQEKVVPGARLFAKVNMGAESEGDIYLYDWEEG